MLTTPPLAPKTVAALHRLGIRTLEELRQTGAVQTFLLLKASGLTLTKSTLWQLESLLDGTPPQEMSQAHKARLLAELKNHPPVAAFPPQGEMAHFMGLALEQAKLSALMGEIPVGAVIVSDGKIIASAHNTCIADCNVSRHAEINALAQAGSEMQNYRLDGCDIYITLEPCAMCASALIQARIRRVIYGAAEPKTGAAGSIVNLFADKRLNTHTAIRGGILQEECRAVLSRFFQNKRKG
ncbi:TPA: tRNA adenosine(34) deaminase TadA [Neisseria lactamica]|uniref:tRNA-specific adenosine deaminase n=1 Tax=Neisseria lactamica ATCC 23970 TaxID=546265 RepID=D0WAK7_NEILA|nr:MULTISPECIES: tRNA adenosine(34) deaminase TadA [Neisseria]EEZ75347.1 cytidine and deoxycytidylate deaminase zinc-binding region [Neisseria lactamica ATCC 23970]KFJ37277.1 cytidine and deoxycytidylate deaminase zinc-binding region family protein [Neisseria lactamica ATCC 23970]MBW3993632.1 nucleoside deaminase [Neisseria meningitidis]RQL22901.1 cytidine deaminase [Neisseria meningitidis]VTQ47857.1 cytosine deaminase [Neisseria lactamica]